MEVAEVTVRVEYLGVVFGILQLQHNSLEIQIRTVEVRSGNDVPVAEQLRKRMFLSGLMDACTY